MWGLFYLWTTFDEYTCPIAVTQRPGNGRYRVVGLLVELVGPCTYIILRSTGDNTHSVGVYCQQLTLSAVAMPQLYLPDMKIHVYTPDASLQANILHIR